MIEEENFVDDRLGLVTVNGCNLSKLRSTRAGHQGSSPVLAQTTVPTLNDIHRFNY